MKIVDVNELAKALNLSVSSIYRKTEHGEIPYFKINDLVRFDEKQVVHYLKTGSLVNSEASYMDTNDVAAALNMSVITLYVWVREDKIPMFKMGGKLVIARDDFYNWIQSNAVNPVKKKKKGSKND